MTNISCGFLSKFEQSDMPFFELWCKLSTFACAALISACANSNRFAARVRCWHSSNACLGGTLLSNLELSPKRFNKCFASRNSLSSEIDATCHVVVRLFLHVVAIVQSCRREGSATMKASDSQKLAAGTNLVLAVFLACGVRPPLMYQRHASRARNTTETQRRMVAPCITCASVWKVCLVGARASDTRFGQLARHQWFFGLWEPRSFMLSVRPVCPVHGNSCGFDVQGGTNTRGYQEAL